MCLKLNFTGREVFSTLTHLSLAWIFYILGFSLFPSTSFEISKFNFEFSKLSCCSSRSARHWTVIYWQSEATLTYEQFTIRSIKVYIGIFAIETHLQLFEFSNMAVFNKKYLIALKTYAIMCSIKVLNILFA